MNTHPDERPSQLTPDRPITESDNPREIRAEIAQTRADMDVTLSAIQERLDPERLKEQVKDQVKDHVEQVKGQVRDATIGKAEHVMNMVDDSAREAGHSFLDRVRANPIPAAVAGFGLAWLFMSGSGGSHRHHGRNPSGRSSYPEYRSRYEYYGYGYPRGEEQYASGGYSGQTSGENPVHQARHAVENVKDRIGDQVGQMGDQVQGQVQQVGQQVQQFGDQVQNRMSDLGDQVQNRFGHFGDDVQDQFAQTRWTLERELRENPLAVGVVAIALGAVVGMLVPETQQEGQFFGPARDQLMQKAQSVAGDALQNVQQTVQQTAQQVQGAMDPNASGSGQPATSRPTSGQQASGQSSSGQQSSGQQSAGQAGRTHAA